MNKIELLAGLRAMIASGEVSREEVMRELGGGEEVSPRKMLSITKILYLLGASVAGLGIIFFAAQIWYDIGSFGRILITFVLGLFFAGMGSAFLTSKPESYLGQVFHALGGFLIPGGALVVLDELSTNIDSLWPVTITIGIVGLFYALLTLYHKNVILTFFTIANATAFVYLFTTATLDSPIFYDGDIYAYLTMAVGISYLLLAQTFQGGWNRQLVGVLNFFGSLGFLGAAFSQVSDSIVWELLYFLLTMGGMALAVTLRSRGVLIVSTLFLIAHFVYITGEYFADSIGWPISLIILGFIIIGLGYTSITLNKKYIGSSQ